ncbi:MAG TPA: histidine phosphatase family protein [Rectinemataceae bacterium]|nr:histidine phosphatase family protein [Rectinemataceae bacterium]
MDELGSRTEGGLVAADGHFFAELPQESRFYIVRHGQSEGNARMVIQGRQDLPLDETGRRQAAAAAAWLCGKGISSISASPLSRAAETASIIAAACGLGAPSLDPVFMEIDTGMFSGLSLDEAKEAHPEAYEAFRHLSWDGVSDAEPSPRIYERAVSAWELLRARALAGERAVACVTHGGFIQWLVRSTFGCRSWMPLLPTSNCGIFELLVEPTGRGRGAYMHWNLLNFQSAAGLKAMPQVF